MLNDGLLASGDVSRYGEIRFQYVPMMSATTPASLALLDRTADVASTLLGSAVIPTRDAEHLAQEYFRGIYPAERDGGYNVDRYPSYSDAWRKSGRSAVARLEALGVYELADSQERFARLKRT